MAMPTSDAAADLATASRGAAAAVTFARAAALNAVTVAMRARLAAELVRWEKDPLIYAVLMRSASPKAFCVGGDVRELAALAANDPATARKALAAEGRLQWYLECYPKPIVPYIDGLIMGSGVGLTLFGTHRVAGPGYRFAMPETAIGYFPDVGVSHVLAAMPGEIGMYLGLTGLQIGRADAFRLGLVTHCLAPVDFAAVATALETAEPLDPLLDDRHADPGEGDLARHAEAIARCFAAPDVPGILDRLGQCSGVDADWGRATAARLAQRSALALVISHRLLREARGLDLRRTLQLEHRLACRLLTSPEFAEGVRALLIDKDNRPRWQYAAAADVPAAEVNRAFAPLAADGLAADELALPTRAELETFR